MSKKRGCLCLVFGDTIWPSKRSRMTNRALLSIFIPRRWAKKSKIVLLFLQAQLLEINWPQSITVNLVIWYLPSAATQFLSLSLSPMLLHVRWGAKWLVTLIARYRTPSEALLRAIFLHENWCHSSNPRSFIPNPPKISGLLFSLCAAGRCH